MSKKIKVTLPQNIYEIIKNDIDDFNMTSNHFMNYISEKDFSIIPGIGKKTKEILNFHFGVTKVSQLYDFYSELLSQKQKQYLNDYFFNDLSLTEISENYEISKQAVSNNIKRTIIELEQFEEKLNLIKLNNERLFLLNEIRKLTDNEEILDYIEQLSKLEN